jgi:AcrR family transcriptional regulator
MPLQRETVARAALQLVDEVGLDGLTTRRLATSLNIQSPTLYWHFTNKQELVNCMAEVMVTMLNYVPGNAFQLQAEPSHTPLDSGSRRSVPLQSAIIDPNRFPTLAHFVDASSIPLTAHEEWFEKGLRLLLNGMRVALVEETEHRERLQNS